MGKYIDRDEAKRHLCQDYAYAAAELLDELPPADVAPVVHGEWIQGGYACGETEWKCSNCGATEWRTSCNRMKYCMFCGAKMDGGAAHD